MAHPSSDQVPVFTRTVLALAAAGLAVLTGIGLLVLWPGDVRTDVLERVGAVQDTYDAVVRSETTVPCQGTTSEQNADCQKVTAELLAGPDEGRSTSIEFPLVSHVPDLSSGDKIVLSRPQDAAPGTPYGYLDRQRKPVLFWLALLFAIAVVLLGRLRGLAALVGLAGTLVLLLLFVLPAIIEGQSPTLVAATGASAIAFLALYLAHGFRPMTTVALLGTIASLLLTVLLASVFVHLASFSGFASEEAFIVNIGAAQIDLAGLILGGVIIGALGAIDDMTVTQASAVSELRTANPEMGKRELTRAGMRIGRDHVASTVNTLFLAYAGASLPLLLLFILTEKPLTDVANSEIVATEIVRTLVGSIGLVASVPITTWLAAHVLTPVSPKRRGPRADRKGDA